MLYNDQSSYMVRIVTGEHVGIGDVETQNYVEDYANDDGCVGDRPCDWDARPSLYEEFDGDKELCAAIGTEYDVLGTLVLSEDDLEFLTVHDTRMHIDVRGNISFNSGCYD